MSKILSAIQRAIEQSGQSRSQIAEGARIDKGQLSRLMRGHRGLSIESLERLCEFLELEIIITPKHPAKRRK